VGRTIAIVSALTTAALCAACSSSSGSKLDGGIVEAGAESDATTLVTLDAGEDGQSSGGGCSEAQLSLATDTACGPCVVQNCTMFLKACSDCQVCKMQLSACPACLSSCSGL
jgi:hypothetical protein